MFKRIPHIRDQWLQLKNRFLDLKWHIKTHVRFWLLEHLYIKEPIEVHDWHDFNHTDKYSPSYLDVRIKLPSLIPFAKWHFRWVFTVENLWSFLNYKSLEDIGCEIHHHSNEHSKKLYNEYMDLVRKGLWTNEIKMIKWIKQNKNRIFRIPIVDFDQVWTSQDAFKEKDVARYTKWWLKENYPGLVGRGIRFIEYERIK